MVEKTNESGWWPSLYEPLRHVREKVADWFAPRADASLGQATYEINIELPGVNPEDVEISMHDNSLIVRGEKKTEKHETGKNYFFSEREYGSFQRTFRLPPDSDTGKIDAAFDAGVLSIRIPRASSLPHSVKKIPIRKSA